MSGVYNRKLFRQGPARDELRKLGGIMSSSEELMREALQTAQNAPGPAGLGPMPQMQAQPMMMPQPMMPQMQAQPMMPQRQAQPMMQPQQPMMYPPQPQMMPQPMMQPQMMPQQPMKQPQDQMMPPQDQVYPEEAYFMPPGVPESVQPQALRSGGLAQAYADKFAEEEAAAAADPTLSATPEEAINANVLDKATGLVPRLDTDPPETVAAEIIDTAATQGAEITGDTQVDLARIYQNLTGDPAAFEKNIDALNRGIIGAAIGAGTSARATENISKGLLIGLEGARATEERRAQQASATQLAMLDAAARAAGKGSGAAASGAASRDYRNPVDAFQDAYQAVMNAGEFDLQIPEGMTREDYAEQVATALIQRSYTPDQLVGSPFEGTATGGGALPPAATNPTGEDVLNQARAAIAAGADEAAIRERLQSLGIDPESL